MGPFRTSAPPWLQQKSPWDVQGQPPRGEQQPERNRHRRGARYRGELKRIKVHGTRHTTATLLLAAGVPVQVVAQRLGHSKVSQTLEVYAHALPDMQRDAAAKLAALLC